MDAGQYEFTEDLVGAGLCSTRQDAPNHQKFPANSYALARLTVGADAYIGPLGSYEFAEDFPKKRCILRADRVVRPYRERGGIFGENDEGDMLQVSECPEICHVRIPSVSFADSSP